MQAGCHSIDAGCIVPPSSVSVGKTAAEEQLTRMITVHVETPRPCARFSSNRPTITSRLEPNGINR
jgi:hypothetical protein